MRMQDYMPYIVGPDKQKYYDYIKNLKLRDFMVPIQDTISRALEIEGCKYFALDYRYMRLNGDGKLTEASIEEANLYAAEYSYDSPICPEYLDIDPQDLTDEILESWIPSINNRIMPIIQNSLTLDKIELIDATPGVSAFYHIFSGYVDPFENDDINDSIAYYYDDALFDLFKLAAIRQNITEMEFKNTIAGFMHVFSNGDSLMVNYQVHYTPDSEHDDLEQSFIVGVPETVATNWAEYILNMIQLKAKVIVVP